MYSRLLGYKPELKQISKLAYPIILGQLGWVLMGVADTIMVGKLGKDALAGVNQANNIFFLLSGLTFGVLFAVSTLVSIKVGEGRAKEGFLTYSAGLLIAFVLFVVQWGLNTTLIYNFEILGQSREVNEIAPRFLKIVNWSVLPMLIFLTCRQFSDGLGHTRISMVITILGLVLNVILNWILISGNLGFPALGIEGAAYATLIARIVMAICGLYYIRYAKFMQQYVPKKLPSFREILPETKVIWKMGIPIALQTFAEWACFAFSGIMVGWYGSVQLAAHAVALNAASVTYMVASGFAIAGSILVGNGFGEHNKLKIRRVANATFILLGAYEVLNALIFIVFNKQIASLYGVTSDVMPLILPLFFLAALFQISDGIQAGAMSILRGIKDVVSASAIAVISYWFVSLPLSYYFGEIWHKEVYGIWMGFTIGLFVASILGVLRFYRKIKKLEFYES
jgi:MATE family multidrug resistance protein